MFPATKTSNGALEMCISMVRDQPSPTITYPLPLISYLPKPITEGKTSPFERHFSQKGDDTCQGRRQTGDGAAWERVRGIGERLFTAMPMSDEALKERDGTPIMAEARNWSSSHRIAKGGGDQTRVIRPPLGGACFGGPFAPLRAYFPLHLSARHVSASFSEIVAS